MSLLFYYIFRGAPRRVYENETLSARAERETGRLYYRLDGGHHRRHRRDRSITPPPLLSIRHRRRPLKIHLDCHSMGSFCRRSGGYNRSLKSPRKDPFKSYIPAIFESALARPIDVQVPIYVHINVRITLGKCSS